MRGIYISNYDLNDKNDGVSKKINSQIKVLEDAGIEMTVLDKNDAEVKTCGTVERILKALLGNSGSDMRELISKTADCVKSEKYDFIYVRKSFLDNVQVSKLMQIRREVPDIKILLEIPTYPYDDEVKIYKKPLLWNDQRARKKLKNCVDRIVTFSKDETIFGIPSINIMNGVSYDGISIREAIKHDEINLIAVAFFAHWHGYDRLIKGMANDIGLVKKNQVHLHLVGKGGAVREYKKLVESTGLEEYVHFHGEKHGEELAEIYNISDIALDSMGRHRVNVFFNSTLKGKEYCAFGMPIISGVKTELDDMLDYPYYYRVPADDTDISIKEVIDFYKSIYAEKEPILVSEDIRNSSMKAFDFKYTFAPVVEYVKDDVLMKNR